ncbi:MAG TPA: type III PLP-dependent enzyme [Candidatus Saccharimonadales bacterium]|nr:type III PLP-dependent enzyme [Candidatus Saccharimonadales bacterium]
MKTDTFTPDNLLTHAHPTPYLLMDLQRVQAAWEHFHRLMPAVRTHYAMKCNPDAKILSRLHAIGSAFEIASFTELKDLIKIGVQPADVIFSNPVKIPADIRRAYKAGLRRFSFDSITELHKLQHHAPDAQVYVRLQTVPAKSVVPSEGKFGVPAKQALQLMKQARNMGLQPFGIAFHVGSQMLDPTEWSAAIQQSGALMRQLQNENISIQMLDMGGGFPAHHSSPTPELEAFASEINSATTTLPYPVELVIEPGRGLVGDAGVMVTSVIGIAERNGATWLHLDVGAFNGMMEALETQNQLLFPLADSKSSKKKARYHLTGPSCDSQDTILFNAELSANLELGDKVFIYTAGAYTTSYASRFNGFNIPKVYCIN